MSSEPIVERLREYAHIVQSDRYDDGELPEEAAAEIERLRAALALAVGELSTYGPMKYTSPEQLMQHFLEEARRGQ